MVQPRFQIVLSEARVGTRDILTRDASAEWTQLYGSWNLSDTLSLSYGLQNFQWGPGELVSPSNLIFHEVGLLRDPLYYVRGKHLVRVNGSIGAAWSGVLLVEVAPNADPAFVAGEPFEAKAQLKLEHAAADGTKYAGVTLGAGERSRPWFGEYGSLGLTEGLSIYVDASHAFNSTVWYPERVDVGTGTPVPTWVKRRLGKTHLHNFILGGARYVFENGNDVRLEYVYDDAGYTRDQLALAADLLRQTPVDPLRLAPVAAPGLQLLARHAGYLSLRVPDLGPRGRLILQARYLFSFTDRSGLVFATALWEVAEAWTLFLTGNVMHGTDYGELSRFANAGAIVGVVYSM